MQARDQPNAHVLLALDDQRLIAQCAVDCYRASGPGGQKRNKTSSAVRLRHLPTGLDARSEEDRSQHVNRAKAVRRLRLTIALRLRGPVALDGYEPTAMLRSYIDGAGRLRVNGKNEDFPSVVAEVLDLLAAAGMRVSEAAEKLGISTAHLSGFLTSDVALFTEVNHMRALAGLKPLRV
jgi:hypothetical protein